MKDYSHIKTWGDYYNEFYHIRSNVSTEIPNHNQREFHNCRLVAKQYQHFDDDTWKYLDSIIIPSEYYPLTDTTFSVFHRGNCKEVTDTDIISCFDKIKVRYGFCYAMADELHELINKKGIYNSIWCGWLLIGTGTPIHHCWVTVGDNDESVLDVQELAEYIEEKAKDASVMSSLDRARDFCAGVCADVVNVPNSVKCAPVGVPSSQAFYIGSRIKSGDEGVRIYNRLIEKHPDHPQNKRRTENGMTKGQELLYKKLKSK